MINQEIETEEESNDEGKGSVAFGILCGGFVLLLLGLLFYCIDLAFLNSRYFNKIAYPPSCDYKVPEGYKIVYSPDENKYAVAVLSKTTGTEYLYNGYGGIRPMYYDISRPCTFDDSCEAKGYLKAYMTKAFSTFK